jgi:hypothetical protein
MPSIGETLREARMRQRLDITDVETGTKIRAKYLRALENEDFGMLPGSTFVKSFLRTYAEFLGLDPHLLVEEYRAQHEPRDESELPQFAPRPRQGRDRRPPPRAPGPLMFGGAVVGAIVLLLFVLGITGGDGGNPKDTGTTAAKKAVPKKKAAKPRTTPRPAVPSRVSLRVVPSGPVYACVDNGSGRVLFEGTLSGPRTFRSRRVRINLGRRDATLRVNGRRVKLPSGSDPIGYDFRRGRRPAQLPSGRRPCA